jgi:hypothetical protein
MKRWQLFLCLCLALLLPTRGGLAAVMPIGHGLGSSPASFDASAHSVASTSTSATPCPHHEAADSTASSAAPHQHVLCDVCNGPALALSTPGLIDATLHPGTQVPSLVSFLSVSLPSEVKPPIL